MNNSKILLLFGVFLFSILTWFACQKQNEALAPIPNASSKVQALTVADGYVYDHDKYGKLFYDHMKNFDGVMPVENYVSAGPLREALKPQNLNPYLAQQDLLFPTLQLKLDDAVNNGVFTNATKDMIFQYQSDVVSFLDNTNTYMTFTAIENFIVGKENAIINRNDVTYDEKMSVLSVSSYVKYFLKLRYDQYLATQGATAQVRGDCPWWKAAGCIVGITGALISTYKYVVKGAKIGGAVGTVVLGIGNATGAAIGGVVGFAIGVVSVIKVVKECEKECIPKDPVIPPPNPCAPATGLAVKIKGCGLVQEVVATGQGTQVNVFTGNINNGLPATIISAKPSFIVTQTDPSQPIVMIVNSSCAGTTPVPISPVTFDFAKLVKDVGFIEIIGDRTTCANETNCYYLSGSYNNNSNNTINFSIPPSPNDYELVPNPDGSICIKWKKEGSYTFKASVTNACGGGTIEASVNVKVRNKKYCE